MESNDKVVWDTPAATAYTKAADEAAALLGTAKGHSDTIAGADLSGLGALGSGFASAWASAWSGHATELDTAKAVTEGYSNGVTTWGKVLGGVDDESAKKIAGTIPGTDEIQV